MAVTGKTNVFFSILLIVMIVGVESGKVFLFAPFISKSVTITFVPLLHELANRGHQVKTIFCFWSLIFGYLYYFFSFPINLISNIAGIPFQYMMGFKPATCQL
jgi:hypothetical protein